jgi:glycine oxidase
MDDLNGLRVVVVGGGAVGSVTALRLLRCGADVLLIDSAARGDNASGVAAGMLAPVFEALLDPVSTDHFAWLAHARDAWPDLADSLQSSDAVIDRAGALFIPPDDAMLQGLAVRMKGFDPACQILSPGEAAALAPGLGEVGPALFTAGDWRLEPRAMLAALQDAFCREGGRMAGEAVVGWSDQTALMASGARYRADRLVLATGAAAAPWAGAVELALLAPIKGQILRFAGSGPGAGPVVRAPGVYVAPSTGGAVVGATMQAGRTDRTIEPDAVAGLRDAAGALFPGLAAVTPRAAAGVRAATPDGLPLVGPDRSGRLILAVGARRNGWLLAPVMAEVVIARLLDRDGGGVGAAFDPARFAPP